MATTALIGNLTRFYVIRHAAYNTLATTDYSITLPTSKGNITIPQLGGTLSLHGRDSKFHVTDYDLGGLNLLYSSAEIFTWKRYGNKRVLVVYGGLGEEHELAISGGGHAQTTEGFGVRTAQKNDATIINYQVSSRRRVVTLTSGLTVYLLDRNSAYNYWVIDLPNDRTTLNYTNQKLFPSAPIVKAGYLLRTVEVSGGSIHLTGDLNSTTALEIIGGAPTRTRELTFNGKSLPFKQNRHSGVITATAVYHNATLTIPNLSTIGWKVIDSLPEIQNSYDDSLWTQASLTYSNNTARNLTTPTSLYSSDYGYHTGSLLYRGHFTATGSEKTLYLATQGGSAFGHSVWINTTFLGSFAGADVYSQYNSTYTLPSSLCLQGENYVITVLIDNMGLDENGQAGASTMKNPRGILDFTLAGREKSAITWKLTGNLGGEDFVDKVPT